MLRTSAVVKFIKCMCDTDQFSCDDYGCIYLNDVMLKSWVYDYYNCVAVKGYSYPIPAHKIIAYIKYGDAALSENVQVRHLNDVKLDNTWDNIGIGSAKQNMQDMSKEKRIAKSRKGLETMGAEASKQRVIKGWASLSKEQRRIRQQKAAAATPKEIRIKNSKLAVAGISTDSRLKAAITRGDTVLSDDNVRELRFMYAQRDATGKPLYTKKHLAMLFKSCYDAVNAALQYKGRFSTIQ
jgi:hypothetical protein